MKGLSLALTVLLLAEADETASILKRQGTAAVKTQSLSRALGELLSITDS